VSCIGVNIGAQTVKIVVVRANAAMAKVMAHRRRPLEVLQELLATPEFTDAEYFGVAGHLGHSRSWWRSSVRAVLLRNHPNKKCDSMNR